MAEKLSFMVAGRVPRGRHFQEIERTVTLNHREALLEMKQLFNSLAETGLVNQIEDRKSPFNGMLVDMIHIIRESDL